MMFWRKPTPPKPLDTRPCPQCGRLMMLIKEPGECGPVKLWHCLCGYSPQDWELKRADRDKQIRDLLERANHE